jgi:hypothetical protein
MPATDIKWLRSDLERSSSSRPEPRLRGGAHLARLRRYAKLDWDPWSQDAPTDQLFPSDESMCAAAEASRTAYSIMHLTKDQLIKIHCQEAFDGFEETLANLTTTAQMLKAVVQMIESARGRMIASACACLQNEGLHNLRPGIDGQANQAGRVMLK